jgi:hypothetical protein
MGISPIPGIGGLGSANALPAEREVEPAVALTRSERLEDDAYQGNPEDRGMEEEDSEPAEGANANESHPIAGDSNTRVNFFA